MLFLWNDKYDATICKQIISDVIMMRTSNTRQPYPVFWPCICGNMCGTLTKRKAKIFLCVGYREQLNKWEGITVTSYEPWRHMAALIWVHSGSDNGLVTKAPSRYQSHCWLSISDMLLHSPENSFTASTRVTMLYHEFELIIFKLLQYLSLGSELILRWTLQCHSRSSMDN